MARNDDSPTNGADSASEDLEHELHSPLEASAVVQTELLPSREPLRTIVHTIGVLEQIAGAFLLLMIFVLVLAQVIQRYIPGSWPWTGELARYSMVWLTFLMAGYLIAYPPHHIAIHIIDYVANERWQAVNKLFVNVVILLISVVMIYGSVSLIANDIGQVTPAGGMPLRFVNTLPLIGLCLVALRALLGIVIVDIPALRGQSGDDA